MSNFQKAYGDNICVQCGKCCANILLLSDDEIDNIKRYIIENKIEVKNRNTFLLQEDSNVCPFLDDNSIPPKCRIYEVRPSICRSFSCNPKKSKTMNYNGVKAINMLFTFGGKNQFSVKAPNLKDINNRIKFLQKKIKTESRDNCE